MYNDDYSNYSYYSSSMYYDYSSYNYSDYDYSSYNYSDYSNYSYEESEEEVEYYATYYVVPSEQNCTSTEDYEFGTFTEINED